MTLEEMMMFKGRPQEFEEYQDLLDKFHKTSKAIGRISEKIFDEIDSLSVFDGDLNERDQELFQKHVNAKRELELKRYKKYDTLMILEKRIQELQGK